MTLVPIVAYVCSLIGMWLYPISRKDELEMEERLVAKRAAALKGENG